MTGIPDDAIRVRLAFDVLCLDCNGTGDRYTDPDGGKWICSTCLGHGTRTVVTDVEVEPSDAYGCRRLYNGSIEERRLRPGDSPLWREVQP